MIEVYFDNEKIEKTCINVSFDNLVEDLLGELAPIINGIINATAVKYIQEDKQEEFTNDMKKVLIAILSACPGTDLDGYKEALGL